MRFRVSCGKRREITITSWGGESLEIAVMACTSEVQWTAAVTTPMVRINEGLHSSETKAGLLAYSKRNWYMHVV